MFLKDINLYFIILPLFMGGVFYAKISRHKIGNPIRDSIKNVQLMLLMTGVICAVMLLLLPSTPSLSTFGYPETVADIDTREKILNLFQDYNRAIVRTTEVLGTFLFILVFWVIASVYQLLKLHRDKVDEQLAAKKNEEAV